MHRSPHRAARSADNIAPAAPGPARPPATPGAVSGCAPAPPAAAPATCPHPAPWPPRRAFANDTGARCAAHTSPAGAGGSVSEAAPPRPRAPAPANATPGASSAAGPGSCAQHRSAPASRAFNVSTSLRSAAAREMSARSALTSSCLARSLAQARSCNDRKLRAAQRSLTNSQRCASSCCCSATHREHPDSFAGAPTADAATPPPVMTPCSHPLAIHPVYRIPESVSSDPPAVDASTNQRSTRQPNVYTRVTRTLIRTTC